MSRSRILSLVLALLFSVVGLAGSAGAQGNAATPEATPQASKPAFAISQRDPTETGYFSVELKPGESAEFVALVQTIDSVPTILRTFATNAINPANGGFDAGTEADELTGAAAWLTYPAQTLDEMSGTEAVEIPFTVTVPADAGPGQYVAALVVQTAEPLPVEGTTMINVLVRSAIAVEIIVPGPKQVSFELGAPAISNDAGIPQLIIPISNTGNWRVRPTGEITIATPDGETVTTAPIELGPVYTGNDSTVAIALPQQFAAGDYVVSGTLTDPDSKFSVTIADTDVAFAPAGAAPQFALDPVSITASGDPVQFANIDITINNSGEAIPTGKVVLSVSIDGEPVEDYILSQNQAMPQGSSTISDRYIPATGWESGTYTFEVIVYSVDASGTESIIATVPIEDTIEIP
ncbi:MAG TPA: hypothetical protein VFP05_18160 [Thermomicrobiales bacterium]|nr:hypothetical protein [Thermomicrobiales bacterium]